MIHASELQFRLGTLEDALSLFALDELCFDPVFRFSLKVFQRALSEPGTCTVVASLAGQLVGFAMLQTSAHADKTAYLMTLDVAPQSRRQGIARALMNKVEDHARQAQCPLVWLHVWDQNSQAVELYKRLGYEQVQRIAGYYGADRDALLYRKQLD